MGGLRCLWVGTMLPQLRILPGQSGRGGAGWLSLGFLFKLPFLPPRVPWRCAATRGPSVRIYLHVLLFFLFSRGAKAFDAFTCQVAFSQGPPWSRTWRGCRNAFISLGSKYPRASYFHRGLFSAARLKPSAGI